MVFSRRLVDISAGVAGLVLFLPAILMSALAVKLYDGQSMLFTQPRVGLDGHNFKIFKIRTMTEHADGSRSVTPVGRILRHVIDELPQFYNMIRGDMALVGPRPLIPEDIREMEDLGLHDFLRLRSSVRPGLAAPAQCHVRRYHPERDGDRATYLRKRAARELDYLREKEVKPLSADLKIIFESVAAIVIARHLTRPESGTPACETFPAAVSFSSSPAASQPIKALS